MARNLVCLTFVSILLGGCVYVEECERTCDDDWARVGPAEVTAAPSRLLRHVVLFKFKDDTSAADIRRIENAFLALPSRIGAIYGLEWGTDVSGENLHKGFTHCFIVSFRSEADRAVYIPHPAHQEFGELLGPHLDDVLVVDYWTK
jgi:hypothetical protein